MVLRFAVDAVSVHVHGIALAGKELGKDVGQWGPSTVSGAIKCVDVAIIAERMLISLFFFFRLLVQSFPEASLASHVDGQIFQTDVYLASYPSTQRPRPCKLSRRGGRAVIVFIGIRLGIDGVNQI